MLRRQYGAHATAFGSDQQAEAVPRLPTKKVAGLRRIHLGGRNVFQGLEGSRIFLPIRVAHRVHYRELASRVSEHTV